MKIKFCGIRRMEDVAFCNTLKPDYMGMILSEGFRRTVPLETARKLSESRKPGIAAVGVFVNASPVQIAEVLRQVPLDVIQLHGSETAEIVSGVRWRTGLPVWKAVRVKDAAEIRRAEQLGADALILEGYVPGQAGGTGVTTSKTTTDSKDNVTVKESSFGTNEKGMTLSTSNKVTDKDGKVTKDTSGTTTMTGDSISVSKTTMTTEKDADGNEKEVTKTSGTTIGSGEVTLKREDGSTIEVGSAIEGMQSDMRELDGRVNRMGVEIKEVGALSAALAGLHPQPENANSRADFAMAMGSYEGKQALAVGGFYRPDKRTMLSIGASTTSSKHMMNMGISIALDRLPEAERKAKEAAKAAGVEQETLNRVLERLAALEQDNRRLQADNEKRDVAYEKLAADYTQLKEKYIEETVDRQQPEQAEAEE